MLSTMLWKHFFKIVCFFNFELLAIIFFVRFCLSSRSSWLSTFCPFLFRRFTYYLFFFWFILRCFSLFLLVCPLVLPVQRESSICLLVVQFSLRQLLVLPLLLRLVPLSWYAVRTEIRIEIECPSSESCRYLLERRFSCLFCLFFVCS